MDPKHAAQIRTTLDSETSSQDLAFLNELDTLLDGIFTDGVDSADVSIYAEDEHADRYTAELQGIFRLAIKDHLRPVVTYVSYILNGEPTVEAIDGLVSILPSLYEAAREVAMYDFADVLERMYALIAPMQEAPSAYVEEDVLRELALNLSCLPALLEMREGDSLHRAMTIDAEFEQLSQTLHGIQSLNSETIHRLFRAGLTTTKSLLTNRKAEIVDVTGIDPDTVDQIIDAVASSPMGQRVLAKLHQRQQVMDPRHLDDIETKLSTALTIREKIMNKLQRQKRLMEQIQRENMKLEAYFVSLSEKLKAFPVIEERHDPHASPETQQLRVRIRSIRQQIEQLTQQNTSQTENRSILMDKIARLQKRYQTFVEAEERMISDMRLDPSVINSLRRSVKQMSRDLSAKEASS